MVFWNESLHFLDDRPLLDKIFKKQRNFERNEIEKALFFVVGLSTSN